MELANGSTQLVQLGESVGDVKGHKEEIAVSSNVSSIVCDEVTSKEDPCPKEGITTDGTVPTDTTTNATTDGKVETAPTTELGENGFPPGVESGIVKWYDITRGFGFIQRETGEDVFIHQSSIPSRPGQRGLADKEPVWFRVARESQDRWRAYDITGPHGAPLRGVPDGVVPVPFGAPLQHAPTPAPAPVPPTDPSEFPPHTTTPLTPPRQRGVAKWFNLQKGFGFIAPEDGTEDVFCHQSNLLCVEGAFRSLAEKENLEFEIVDEPNQTRAKRKAIHVTGPGGRPVVGVPRPTDLFAGLANHGGGVFYPNHPAYTPGDFYGQQYQQHQYQHYQQQQYYQQNYQTHSHQQPHEQPQYQSQFQHQYQHQPQQRQQQQSNEHTDWGGQDPSGETEAQYAERQAAWQAYYEQLAHYQQHYS